MARIPRRLARGSAAEIAAYTGPSGEPIFNQSTGRLHMQDGSTPGGVAMSRKDEVDAAFLAVGLPPLATPINLGLQCAAAAGALTLSLTDIAGSALSVDKPAMIPFRSATSGMGTLAPRLVSGANTLVISNGSTLGVPAINAPFALWVVVFDDAGTVRLGVINTVDAGTILPLDAAGLANATAEGGAGGADSPQVFYSTAAMAAKAYQIVARLEWSVGLAAVGSWVVPTRIDLFHPAMRLPGSIVQSVAKPYGASSLLTAMIPYDDTIPLLGEGTEVVAIPVTPSSPTSMFEVEFTGWGTTVTAGDIITAAVFRDAISNALFAVPSSFISATDSVKAFAGKFRFSPAAAAAFTLRLHVGGAGGSIYLNGVSGGRRLGGVAGTWLFVRELKA